PEKVTLKDRKSWKLIGKGTRRLDTPEKITGKAKFGMDVQFPGLRTALVARAPVFGGKVKSFDAAGAKAVPGVEQVVQVSSGVAVVATNFWSAKQGREARKIEWDNGPGVSLDGDPHGSSVAEAVQVAKAAGVPVKTVWTREDDIKGGLYRPLFFHRMEVGVDAKGMPVAWKHTIVGQSIMSGTPFERMIKDGIDP